MYKCLDFQILRNIRAQLFDFFQRQLSGGNHAARALFIPEIIGSIVCIVCLSTDMSLNLRTHFFCDLKHSRIRNNKSIRLDFLEFLKIFTHSRQILIVCQDIGCYIHFHIMFMRKCDSFFHVLHGKVLRFCAESKCFSSDINRICSKNDCCL